MSRSLIDGVAEQLEALEETIILRLIDRAQFRVNRPAYEPGGIQFRGEDRTSLFELRLRHQEEMDAVFGRFAFPEERPFTRGLPEARRKVTGIPDFLRIPDYDRVNLTAEVKDRTLAFVYEICPPGDDGQYGSATEHDVYVLQAVSRRIHYGAMYVAEGKYRADPALYRRLIEAGDTADIEARLTRPEVERRICRRVVRKTRRIQAEANRRIRTLVAPQAMRRFYREAVIPLTRKGEVLYLTNRTEEA